MKQFNSAEDFAARKITMNAHTEQRASRRSGRGQAAVWQARLLLLVMINIAQLWILAATIEAALASHYSLLIPLVISSGVCFLITLSILLWWKPVSRKQTSTGYIRTSKGN